jgi:hypothetical protein
MGIPVYYVDPVPVVYGERTRDDEVRTEATWSIQTVADCRGLIGKRLGIKRTNGEYVRGWLRDVPHASDELHLLRESNRSEEVRLPLGTIQMVEIIQRSFLPMEQIQAPGDYLQYCTKRVVIELTTGERVSGLMQDLSDTGRHLVLSKESRGGEERVLIPLATIGAIQALGQPPPARRKASRAGRQPRKQPEHPQAAAPKKCVHGRDPAFCCDCRYTE